jgi:hypothetical protein
VAAPLRDGCRSDPAREFRLSTRGCTGHEHRSQAAAVDGA